MAGGIMRNDVAIYVDTNISTRLLFQAARNQTMAELRELLKRHHESLYPEMGTVTLQEMMVEVNSSRYPIVDRVSVGGLFRGKEGFLKVNVVCQTGGQICLPVERGDAFQSNSQLPENINLVEGAINTRAESAANASGKSYSKLLDGESSEGKPAFSDKMLFEADFLTQSSSGNVDDSVGSQLEESGKSEGKETCLSVETGGNTTIRSLDFSAPEICLNSLINIQMCKESQVGMCLASEGTSVRNGKSQRIKADALGVLGESTNFDSRELLLSEQNQAPRANESSHPLDVYTQDQVNQVKSKKKGSKSSKSRFRRMRHEADRMKALTDTENSIDQMAMYSEEKAFSLSSLGGTLWNNPLSKTSAMCTCSEGTKIIGAMDEMPTTSKPTNVRRKTENPCPAGCGRVFRGKTSAWYLHKKTCNGF